MSLSFINLSERLRLEDLYTYDILDTSPEREFDELVELAAQIYGCPIAAITFIDEQRQWLKAKTGISATETTRDIAFCSHTIQQKQELIIQDACQDERFRDNPLVKSDPHIRFYAGVPIISTNGNNLGAVCIIDRQPRELSSEQTKGLKIISNQITKLLELRKKNMLLKEIAEEKIKNHKSLLKEELFKQERQSFMVSTELHENIAQGLAATKLYLEMAEVSSDVHLIQKSKDNVSKLLDATRLLSHKIYPSTLKEETFKNLSEQVLFSFEKETGVKVEYSFRHDEKLPHDLKVVFFIILDEQLKNIRKHANASQVTVKFDASSTANNLLIEDNGIGFDTADLNTHYGLNKIASLADFYNGVAEVRTAKGQGCSILVSIPPVS